MADPAPLPAPAVLDPFAELAASDDAERRRLRRSLAVAFAVHAVLLAVTIPRVYSQEPAAEKPERQVFVVQQPRFKPPDPAAPAPAPPPPPVRRVAVPDPDPDHDPLPVEEPPPQLAVFDLDLDALELPAAPPAPPPELPAVLTAGVGGVSKPVRIHFVEPRYTELARRARIQGTVVLKTIVRADGTIGEVDVLKGLPMGLAESAVEAVRQWRYEPGLYRGKPVDVYYHLTVIFGLH